MFVLCLQAFAPLPVDGLDQIRDVDRAGVVFLREGATTVKACMFTQEEICEKKIDSRSKNVTLKVDSQKAIW